MVPELEEVGIMAPALFHLGILRPTPLFWPVITIMEDFTQIMIIYWVGFQTRRVTPSLIKLVCPQDEYFIIKGKYALYFSPSPKILLPNFKLVSELKWTVAGDYKHFKWASATIGPALQLDNKQILWNLKHAINAIHSSFQSVFLSNFCNSVSVSLFVHFFQMILNTRVIIEAVTSMLETEK